MDGNSADPTGDEEREEWVPDPVRGSGDRGDRGDRGYRAIGVMVRVVVGAAAALVLVVLGILWVIASAFTDHVHHLPADALASIPNRPPAPSAAADGRPPMTLLLLGSDRRLGADAGGGVTGERADAIMLIHLSGDRQRVDVLSIPRDSWVPVPGHGTTKINASLGGGPALVVQTVENLTGVHVDDVAVIDFTGVRDLTTALGGVTVLNAAASTDPQTGTHFDAGPIVLSGDRALTFVRQRYGLLEGDFDRITHQQQMISAIGVQLRQKGVATNPMLLARIVSIVGDSLTVDAGMSTERMSRLLTDVLLMPQGGAHFYTAPHAGYGRSDAGESYVQLDPQALATASAALREDRPLALVPTPLPGQ